MPSAIDGFLRCRPACWPVSSLERLKHIQLFVHVEPMPNERELSQCCPRGKTMRTCYIVAYDIADPKRLQRVHRTMCGYGDPLQYSVFRCILSPSERVLLLEALTPLINHRGDQIMLANLGPADGRAQTSFETLGRALASEPERVAVIV